MPARPVLALALAWCCPVPPAAAAGAPCAEAIAREEARTVLPPGLPPGLLAAVARVESGGRPWAYNAAGTGFFPFSREEALAGVRAVLARGERSVDVGCMQVNLRHHPAAFTTLEEAFEPAANVAYAARFLRELRARHGTWHDAIGRYHSATPGLGADYLRRVMAAWGGAPAAADTAAGAARHVASVRIVTPGGPAPGSPSAPMSGLPVVFTPSRR